MKSLYRLAIVFMSLGIFSWACQKELQSSNTNPPPTDSLPPVDIKVTASVAGRIVDETGTPVSGAIVTAGSSTNSTDINGHFSFSNISISKYFGTIKIVKEGYFTVTKTIITNTSSTSYLEVKLLTRRVTGSFSSGNDASVTVDGSQISFKQNTIVTASSGAAYTGTVTVYAAYLNPTDPDLESRMPGDLRGVDASGKSVGLETFGMLAVELEGASGEKLQIASGSTATISVPIPASLQSKAPASLPLWYFNDTTGQWIQQGTAVNQAGVYVGSVPHFSYWNYDVSVPIVYFNGFIKDQSGNPVAYTRIDIIDKETGETRSGWSGADGSIYGGLVANAAHTLKVVNKCGDELGSKDIGPFSSNTDLGTIAITLNGSNTVTISGTAVDCSNNPIASGFAEITLENFKYEAPITNGAFSIVIDRCSTSGDSAFIVVGDYASLALSPVQGFYVTTGNAAIGQLSVCGGSFSQFISFTIGSSSYSITVPPDSIVVYSPGYLSGMGGNYNSPSFKFFDLWPFNMTGTGIYDGVNMQVTIGSTNYAMLAADPGQLTITQYGAAIGDDIIGSFTGNIYTDTLNTATRQVITGTLKIKRGY